MGAPPFGSGNSIGPTFAAEVGLEFGKDTEHAEECPAGSTRSVNGLFGGREMGPLLLDLRNNDLKVAQSTGQAAARTSSPPAGSMSPSCGPSGETGSRD